MKVGLIHIGAVRLSLLHKRCASARREGGSVRPRAYERILPGLLLAGLGLLVSILWPCPTISIASVQGDHIVNSAQFAASGITPVSASVTVTVLLRTNSSIEFLKYAPGDAAATPVNVAPGAYRTGSDPAAPFAALPPPVPAGSTTPVDLSNPIPLVPATLFHAGEPIFIQVTDPDQNLDRTRRETVFATITDNTTGDLEVVRLTETGPDTGVFVGYIQSTANPSSPYDGVLTVATQSNITASYTDIADNTDSCSCSALVDPSGFVFDSSNGSLLNNVQVTLVDSNGKPVTVIGDGGENFPNPVYTGTTFSTTDKNGIVRHYDFPDGGFRFPFVFAGQYQFHITPPTGYTAPSSLPYAKLQQLWGTTFTIVNPGSRLEQFTVNVGSAIHIDIPLDPPAGSLWLKKTAGADTVSTGDFLPYELDVTNSTPTAQNVFITDTLPLGFRYRKGSTRINGKAAPDPAISSDGRTLKFSAGSLDAAQIIQIRYVVEVAAGAKVGTATNQARANNGNGISSNLATASVQVKSDFLSTRSILMGQVIAGACGAPDPDALKGLEGVRIFMEDGTFVDTDKRGMFHFEGIKPGSHVVQLDLDSLPKNYQVVPCEVNTRFAGSSYSQFVDVQGGSMWRVDFHVARQAKLKKALPEPTAAKGEVSLELTSSLFGENIVYQLPMQGHNMPKNDLQLTVTLPEGVAYEANSSQLDGKPLANPAIAGPVLTYPLGSRPGDWNVTLRFRAILPGSGESETLSSKATITVNGITDAGKPMPVAENVLRRVKEQDHFRMPEFVLHPHFPTFSAELSAEDRMDLDELARLLMVLNIEQIKVIGHTDNVRISSRSRDIYHDNTALSLARAESVGHYLIEKLHLPPAKLELKGMGETMPVADNRSEEGRMLNRRVEVKLLTEKVVNTICHQLVKEKSGIQKAEIKGSTPQPLVVEEKDEPEPANPQEKQDGIHEKEGILSPSAGVVMVQPIHAVRICLKSLLTPHLFLDGKEIPADRIGFTMKDPKSGMTIYSYIGVDFGKQGKHTLELKGMDPFGNARVDQTISVIRSGEIAAIRLKSADNNIADGRTPVKLQLEVLDAAGQIIPAEVELEIRSGTLKPMKKENGIPELAKKENTTDTASASERVHLDEKGNALFQPVNASGLYRVIVGYNKVTLEAETYVKPMMRDWILVGLGEGTVGYNAVAGHIESLRESDQDDHLYDNGRLAFYAKGKVKGEWLLTMAYDSGKGKGDVGNASLFQTIDPNTYYTLYGDAGQQLYDAASARKIYLKIEHDQFYALFGDFDTGLTVTELSKYSRKMNGVKAEYHGKNVEANVFGSETAQAYAKDEIQGDGTSGLYHLSHTNIVLNSDTVTIEVRDRFRSEIIISSTVMNRFTDYNIDPTAGTIFFQQPVMSRDNNLNPVFIVVEYEVNGYSQAYTYGGRVGVKLLDQKLKAGFTYIHEGQVSGDGNSYGFDASYKPTDGTTIKAEIARTDTKLGDKSTAGNAYLVEVDHKTENLDAKIYYRELGEGFGLGQQNNSETATRKGGFDVAYKLNKEFSLSADAYRQYNLSTGGVEDVAEAKTTYASGPYKASLGFRHADDTLGTGPTTSSNQVTMGGSWLTLDKKLTLRVEHDQSIGGSSDTNFPTSTTFGADYALTKQVTFFGQQVITSGSGVTSANTTSVGMKATPWTGGAFNTSFGQNLDENGDRMFALFGLKQTWKVTDKWSVDSAFERNQTLANSQKYQFNANYPPPSGDTQAFTSVSLGSTYTEKKWNWSNRLELRTSDTDSKWGIVSAYVGEPVDGWGWSARCEVFDTKSPGGAKTVNGDLRLGMVYRPLYTRWILLDRLDLLYNDQQGGTAATGTTGVFNTENRRIVNNLSANFKMDNKTQISLFYGAKYALDSIDGTDYSGYTDLIGIEGRYDLTKKWDIGIRGSVLHSWNASQINYSAGPSVGYNVIKNAWISLGYNLAGFTDKDFSASNYTAQGPYVRFRFKFDQNSVKDAVSWLNL